MTEEQIERSRRQFEIAGAIISSLCFGLILWMMSLPSFRLEPMTLRERLSLIPYLLLTSSCYLGLFWLLNRYYVLPSKGIRPHWVAISLFGTALSFIISTLPSLWRNGLNGDVLFAIISLLGFFSILMLGVMAFIWSIGFIVRLIRKEMDENRVVLD